MAFDRWCNLIQNESELITSPPARVPRDCQVLSLTVCFMNLTDPSAKPMLTPPGWLLRKAQLPSVRACGQLISQSVGIPLLLPHPGQIVLATPVLSGGELIRGKVKAPVWGMGVPG